MKLKLITINLLIVGLLAVAGVLISSPVSAQTACPNGQSQCSSDQECIAGTCEDKVSSFDTCVLQNGTTACCSQSLFASEPTCVAAKKTTGGSGTPPPDGSGGGSGTPPPGNVGGSGTPPPTATSLCPNSTDYEYNNGICVPKSPYGSTSLAGQKNFSDLVTLVLKWLLTLAGIIAVVVLIIGGYQYMTSNGNEEQAEKGRKTITNAIIGLVVVILSYTLVSVITNFFTKTS